MNMFSMFDMSYGGFLPMIFGLMALMMIPSIFFLSFWSSSLGLMMSLFLGFSLGLFKAKYWKGLFYFNLSLFFLIYFMNMIGLLPFNFGFSSQVSVVFLLSFISFFSCFSFTLINNYNNFVSHMVPESTPIMLVIFLFLIELISNLIRPVTLLFRLLGNIVSGHIFLYLIFMLISSMGFCLIFLNILYMGIELVVAFLQAYIFITLVTMYSSEV